MSPERHYGTNGTQAANGVSGQDADESAPLLAKDTNTSAGKRFASYLSENVDEAWADLLLLLGYVITGLLDSSAVFIWGAFVSMQTGNTIYLGLGISDPSSGTRWIKSLTSICCFCLGSFIFSRFHNFFGPKRRWVLITSYSAQLGFIVVAGIMVTLDKTKGNDLHWHVLVPLGLVAFQSSGQTVTSRALHYNSLTSTVLTSIYCDLFGDQRLFVGITQNVERNRRAAAPLLLLGGAVVGGFFSRSSVGLSGALWLAAALKLSTILAWTLWKKEPVRNHE